MIEANKFWRFELHSVVDELTQTKTEKKKKKSSIWLHNFQSSKIDVAGQQKESEGKKTCKNWRLYFIQFIWFDFSSVLFVSICYSPLFVSMQYRERDIFIHRVSVSLSCWPVCLAVSHRSRRTNEIHLKIEIKLNRQAINTNESVRL